ncbi:hypothetical protein [Stenotrophomonas sp. PS02297]|uniref:hypothetical protein n=1 Tax=Stenotrophomonas sp. PS02297 TaxID=2991423 RepID=UPI00249BD50C|nr:hypothetical protein [Stenotrophomonas sp. PS02297]
MHDQWHARQRLVRAQVVVNRQRIVHQRFHARRSSARAIAAVVDQHQVDRQVRIHRRAETRVRPYPVAIAAEVQHRRLRIRAQQAQGIQFRAIGDGNPRLRERKHGKTVFQRLKRWRRRGHRADKVFLLVAHHASGKRCQQT